MGDAGIVKNNMPAFRRRFHAAGKNRNYAEKRLWYYLRGGNFHGLKFFRRYRVDDYLFPFFCPDVNIAVELYGSRMPGEERRKYEKARSEFLSEKGITLIRVRNKDALDKIEAVLEDMEWVLLS